jgi:hypothetical protein
MDKVKFLETRQILRGPQRLKVLWKIGKTYSFEPEMERLIADGSAVRVRPDGVIGIVEKPQEVKIDIESTPPIHGKRRKIP